MEILLIFLGFAVCGIHGAVIERSMTENLSEQWKYFEERNYTVEGVIQSNGYEVETHQVTTTDGYILTLHRIPSGNTGKNNSKVAFLQHGLLLSSADWVLMGAGKSLGFILADAGYDVWMGNVRGNTFSRKHISLDPSESKFWNFSWHEIGTIDVPQMIDYVLNETQTDAVYFVGHSQGTTVYYVMTSMLPEYNSKIKVQVSLAPIGYMKHLFSPLPQFLAFFIEDLEEFFKQIGTFELLPNTDFIKYFVGDVLCQKNSTTQELCIDIMSSIYGFNKPQLNTTLLPFMFKFIPAGGSSKQFLHYGQEIKSGYFRQYDYGKEGNLQQYGDESPPSYNLENITAPTYFFYSKNDWLAAEVDVEKLCEEMKNGCKGKTIVSDPKWNHLDFIYGIDAAELIYHNISSLFENFQ